MSSIVQLKRSALSGKVPGTGSLNLGELALNTYDGKIFFRRSGSTDTIQEVVTTNVVNTGSVTLTGTLTAESIRTNLTASFGSLKVNDTLTVNHGETIISGSALVTSDLTILGAVNARQFNIAVISSSVLFESGSSRFGNTLDDTHDFTGSVQISGSQNINGNIYLTGSIIPSGSASFDLGSQDHPFRHSYVGSGSYYLAGNKILSLGTSGEIQLGTPNASWGTQLNVYDDVIVHGDNGYAFMDYSGSAVGAMQMIGGDDIYFENQYKANGGFQFRNTHPSCSIWGGNYMTVRPDYIYMNPASYLDLRAGILISGSLNTSIAPRIYLDGSNGNITISGSSTTIQGVNFSTFSSSLNSRLTTLTNLTSSYTTTGSNVFSGSQTITGSVTATSFVGNGSGLTDLVVDLGSAQLNDVDGNNIPARSFAELFLACVDAQIVDLDFGI